MDKRVRKVTATAALGMMTGLLVSIPAAQAWDVTYDFKATGNIYHFENDGCSQPELGSSEEVTGSVTFKVLSVQPPASAYTDGQTYASCENCDWVVTEFTGETSEGSLDPAPFDESAPSADLYYIYEVNNLYDSNYSNQSGLKQYRKVDEDRVLYRDAFMHRFMYGESSWFSGLGFDPGRSPQYNYLYRGDYYIDYGQEVCPEGSDRVGYYPAYGTNGLFVIDATAADAWVLSSIDLMPLADKLAATQGGKGLSVLVSSVQAYYDAGDVTSACQMLVAFSHQAQGLAHNRNFAEMVESATLDAELIGKILECD
jgi:hypothetical protein